MKIFEISERAREHFNYYPKDYKGKGVFTLVNKDLKNIDWMHSCRESISVLRGMYNPDNKMHMGYYCLGLDKKNLVKAFNLIAKQLKLKNKDKIIFHETSRNGLFFFQSSTLLGCK